MAEQTEQTEPVSTSGSRGSPMSSNKTQQRGRGSASQAENCLRLRICSKLQEFCAAAHRASVTLYRERTKCAQHKVYIGGVRKPGSTCHSLIVSDGPTVSLKSRKKNEVLHASCDKPLPTMIVAADLRWLSAMAKVALPAANTALRGVYFTAASKAGPDSEF